LSEDAVNAAPVLIDGDVTSPTPRASRRRMLICQACLRDRPEFVTRGAPIPTRSACRER
jgi:hypothetical protein